MNTTQLARLPVPDLRETCSKYLRSIRPLVSDEEYAGTERVVQEFVKPGGEGERLQELLMQRAESMKDTAEYPHCSWLEEWWDSLAYLSDPQSLLNVNYFGTAFEETGSSDPLFRAASIVAGMLFAKQQYESGDFKPDYFSSQKKQELCMFQYTRIIGGVRVAGLTHDTLEAHRHSRHMAVCCKGEWYTVPLIRPNGTTLSVPEIITQLQRVRAAAEAVPSEDREPPVAALTLEDRRVWGRVRAEMLAEGGRAAASLREIETALFVLALDDDTPTDGTELMMLLHTGNGSNRWMDKVTSLIVFANGTAGFNGEHAAADAPIPARLLAIMEAVTARLEAEKAAAEAKAASSAGHDAPRTAPGTAAAAAAAALAALPGATASSSVPGTLPAPRKLYWDLPPSAAKAVQAALAKARERIPMEELGVVDFDDFGTEYLKAQKLSPDAFVQMALQLAYFRDQGRITATYETGSTRKFFHGRTETCRAVCSEVAAFVHGMQTPGTSAAERLRLLHEAVHANRLVMQDAVNGKGVDRHLLGLYMVSKVHGLPVPSIFTDPSYAHSTTFLLSTSQLTTPVMRNRPGFPAPYEEGYGVCYGLYRDFMRMTCTSKALCPTTDAGRFTMMVVQALRDMREVCEGGRGEAAGAPQARL